MSSVTNIDDARQPKGLTVTLGQLLDAVGESAPGLPSNGPLARTYALIFPADKASLRARFRRLMRDVLQEVETFNPQREEIVKKYGTLSVDGTQYRFEGENFLKYQTELNAARSVQIVLQHELMPELMEVWNVSPVEEEALVWLVGEID